MRVVTAGEGPPRVGRTSPVVLAVGTIDVVVSGSIVAGTAAEVAAAADTVAAGNIAASAAAHRRSILDPGCTQEAHPGLDRVCTLSDRRAPTEEVTDQRRASPFG